MKQGYAGNCVYYEMLVGITVEPYYGEEPFSAWNSRKYLLNKMAIRCTTRGTREQIRMQQKRQY